VTPDRTITIAATVAELRSRPGPWLPAYVLVLANGITYRWLLGSAEADDGRHTLRSTVGGYGGAWLAIRSPDAGADLDDEDATLVVGDGGWRRIPTSTLTAGRTLTLGTDGAAAGDTLEITRLDVGAFTVAIVNGGDGGGTLATMPISARSNFVGYFNGTDWLHRRSGLLL